MKLQVSYKSQFDSDCLGLSTLCGPACVAMILNYYGENLYTSDIYKRTGATKGLITIAQLQKAIGYFSYGSGYVKNCNTNTITGLLKKKIPAIALIRYSPLSSRQDKGYKDGHFVVITGIDKDCFIVNDPDFYGNYREHGHHHRYLKKEFLEAWSTCHYNKNPNNSLLMIYRKEKPMNDSPIPKNILTNSNNWKALMKGLNKTGLSVGEVLDTYTTVSSQARELTEFKKMGKGMLNQLEELEVELDETEIELEKVEKLKKEWHKKCKQVKKNNESLKRDNTKFQQTITKMKEASILTASTKIIALELISRLLKVKKQGVIAKNGQ